jgi:CspA family cold shock protein
MACGKIRWFSPSKGYGFIIPEDGTDDVFIHYSQLSKNEKRQLSKGDEVVFDYADGEKGPKAINIEIKPNKHILQEK